MGLFSSFGKGLAGLWGGGGRSRGVLASVLSPSYDPGGFAGFLSKTVPKATLGYMGMGAIKGIAGAMGGGGMGPGFWDPANMYAAAPAASGAGTIGGAAPAAAGGFAGPGASTGLKPVSAGGFSAMGSGGTSMADSYRGMPMSFGAPAAAGGYAGAGASAGISPVSAGSWFSRIPTGVKWGAGLGMGSILDLLTGREKAKEEEKSMSDYFASLGKAQEAAQWTPESRAGMMKGVAGFMGKQVGAVKKRLGKLNIGGGRYGKQVESVRRAGRETAATALAGTYGPRQIPVGDYRAYMARGEARAPFASWLQRMLGTAGTALGTYGTFKLAKGLL